MSTTSRNHAHAMAIALVIGLVAPGAAAQAVDGGPTPEGKAAAQASQAPTEQPGAESAPGAESTPGSENAPAESAGQEGAGGASPDRAAGAATIARWLRSIGGRICMGPILDADVGQAVGRAVEVGVVDLPDVAGEDDLGALADAGDDGLDLVGREVLGLVDDHELVGDGSAADVGQRLEHELPSAISLLDALLGVLLSACCMPAPRWLSR
jgi:hypothetical protein